MAWAVSVLVSQITRAARRRRRRRAFSILVVVLTAGLAAVAILGTGATRSRGPVFVQDPYMGVSCHRPGSIACDRVGLAVWLARPAAVTATIEGAPLKLDDPYWSYATRQGRKPLYVYAGFLRPAGLGTRLHVGSGPLVRFRIDYGRGHVVITQGNVWLNAGWG